MNYFYFPVSSGTLLMTWTSHGLLSGIEWSPNRLAIYQKVNIPKLLAELIDQIRAYFYYGEPIEKFPWDQIDQSDWTDFQRSVYFTISRIPHGETRTYGWVAKQIGHVSASRAVGQALKKNPLPILIPCHRVLSSTSIGGFMGVIDPDLPELQLKKKLMNLEADYCSPVFSFITTGMEWRELSQVNFR